MGTLMGSSNSSLQMGSSLEIDPFTNCFHGIIPRKIKIWWNIQMDLFVSNVVFNFVFAFVFIYCPNFVVFFCNQINVNIFGLFFLAFVGNFFLNLSCSLWSSTMGSVSVHLHAQAFALSFSL
jgi:hypothetical protein